MFLHHYRNHINSYLRLVLALILGAVVMTAFVVPRTPSSAACGSWGDWAVGSVSGIANSYNPGASITGSFQYQLNEGTSEPSSIKQILVGIVDANGNKVSVASSCVYNGIPAACPSWTTGTGTISVTAPTNPGTYRILADEDAQYTCSDAINRFPVQGSTTVLATFTVERANNSPNTPSNPSPATHATGVDINADLSWTGGDPDAGDTVTYAVYFGTSSTPPLMSHDTLPATESPIIILGPEEGLAYNNKYYWKIVATDEHGASTTGPLWYFTTQTLSNNPPNTPSNPSPANHASGMSTINTVLYWTSGDPDAGDTVTYDVYFGDTSSPPYRGTIGPYSTTSTEQLGYGPGVLSYDTQYYWYIAATDNHGASTTGPLWDFTTQTQGNNPPDTPFNVSPANHATGVSLTDALQSSVFSDPDEGDSHAASQWQVTIVSGDYSSPIFDSGTDTGNLTQTTIPSGILDYGTTYYWRVRYQDSSGSWSEWSEETQFKTEEAPPNGWIRFVMPGAIVLAGIVLLGTIWRNTTLRMKRNMRRWEEEGYDLSDWR